MFTFTSWSYYKTSCSLNIIIGYGIGQKSHANLAINEIVAKYCIYIDSEQICFWAFFFFLSEIASHRLCDWIPVTLEIIYSMIFTYSPPACISFNSFWFCFGNFFKKVLRLFNIFPQASNIRFFSFMEEIVVQLNTVSYFLILHH
jgi:hypothetical protein